MNSRWPHVLYAAVAAVSVCLFAAGGHFGATALIDAQRARQLDEFGAVALRRSERAIDFGVAALDELARRGEISCDSAALQMLRLHVYQRGSVKDIRVVNRDGSIVCSAYSETLEFDRMWATRADMQEAMDPAVRLFRVDQFFGVALGVMKDTGAESGLVAILGINGSLFDILPEALHDHGDVVLALSDGAGIAHSASRPESGDAAGMVRVTASSSRYPLTTTVLVENDAYEQWNREPYRPIMGLFVGLGLAFGLLLGRAVAGSRGPIAELDHGLAAREFQPYLQPLFDLDSRRIVGGEVLARWITSDGTVVPPQRFIQLAADGGRIGALTWQVVGKALAGLQPLLRDDKHFMVSVNIDPRHFVAPGFVDELRRAVAAARVSTRQIVLELTEREGFEDLDRAASVVETVRDLGFKVAIDDVGIGHSGLSHIQRLGANTLKIDKFFVDALDRNPTANAVVEMLVRLAAELQMGVVAEGIESDAQIFALRACGVTTGQGYLVSPPVPMERFLALLDQPAAGPEMAEPRAVKAA